MIPIHKPTIQTRLKKSESLARARSMISRRVQHWSKIKTTLIKRLVIVWMYDRTKTAVTHSFRQINS